MKSLFVGNLSYEAGDADLAELFKPYGEVSRAKVILDRETGQSRGFGFVDIEDDQEAALAIQYLHESEFMGRNITVNEAQPRQQQSRQHRRDDQRPRNGGGHQRGRERNDHHGRNDRNRW